MTRLARGAVLAALVIGSASGALAFGRGGGNSDTGAGLNPYPQAGNDRTGGALSGAGRSYPQGVPQSYYGTYYGQTDPGYAYRPPVRVYLRPDRY